MTEDLILIGTITAPQGLDGSVRVQPIGEAEALLDLKRVHLEKHGWMSLKNARLHNRNLLVMRIAGINTVEAAEGLRGLKLQAEKTEISLPDGAYYYHDLIGLPVYSPDKLELGRVRDVIDSGAQDVLVIAHQGRDVLVPLQAPYVRVLTDHLEIEPIPGLFEA
jgi:16S rRNA processing protein RimM